ncbi:MAG: DUF2339 domain-containing protein, partial [Desulfuromonadales bacterium]|nr:DUF2339 domain-containing protein [Desulfuromonadales bacterium]
MAERIELLEARVEALERELKLLREAASGVNSLPLQPAPPAPQMGVGADDSEDILTWVGKSALLPRIAATSFLLVIALILRTVTDNGLLDQQLGSVIGVAYALVLIGTGWYQYGRTHPLAPIFTVWGAVLMYVIVIESHARFASLPTLPAYAILLVTGGATAAISYRYSRALPVLIGTLGMGVAAVAIDYPTPYFPQLALVLLVANLLGAFATRLESCSWLRWILLLLTVVMMQVWGVKLSLPPRSGLDPQSLGEPWFFPVLTLFALVFFAVGLWAVVRPSKETVSRFDLLLPTVTSLWVFALSAYMLRKEEAYLVLLGLLGLMLATGFYAFAANLRGKGERLEPAVAAYLVASVSLLGVGMWATSGGMLSVLVLFSLAACALAVLSKSWGNDGLRTLSYLLQVGTALALAGLLLDRGPEAAPQAQLIAAAVVSGCGWWHFRWCRRTPPGDASLVARVDPEDRSAVLLLLGSLVSAFFFWRSVLYLGGG